MMEVNFSYSNVYHKDTQKNNAER